MDLRTGTTPIAFFSNFILAKMENKNPSGSIKDRVTEKYMNSLKNDSVIRTNSELITILNGEFAVSFAFFCAKKSYKAHIVCSDKINKNHYNLCKLLGADMYMVDSKKYSDFVDKKNEIRNKIYNCVFIDFYDEKMMKKMYELSFCQELHLQLNSHQKKIKNAFLFSESGFLAESIKDSFPKAKIYNVKIKNAFFNFNGQKKDIVNSLNIFSERVIKKDLFESEIDINFDKVVENIKNVASKSGLIMDYRTSACYLAAKEYVCFNDEVNLIIFYENGERYIQEIFSI